MDTQTPVAIYARISEDRLGEEEGVDLQVKRCRAYAKKHGLKVVKVLIDNDISAYSRKPRPDFEELVTLAESGAIKGCVVRHVDRLYRRNADLEKVIDRLDGSEMTVHAVMSSKIDLSSADGRMVARMIGAAATNEVEKQGERKADKFRKMAEDGKPHGGRVPLGYEADRVTINEREAEAIRGAVDKLLDPEAPWSMNRTAGWVTKQIGRTIAPTTLREILLNPRLIGKRVYISAAARQKAAKGKRSLKHNGLPKSDTEGLIFDAVWPAILPEDRWTEVVTLITDPRRKTHSARPRKSLLAGLLKCGYCAEKGRDSSLGYSKDSYKCPTFEQKGCGGRVTISTTRIEEHVRSMVTKRLETMKHRDIVIFPDSIQGDLTSEWDQLERQRRKHIQLFDGDHIDYDELNRRNSDIKKRMYDLGVAEKEFAAARIRGRRVFDAIDEWESAPTLAQAEIIKILVHRILIEKAKRSGRGFDYGRIHIEWNM